MLQCKAHLTNKISPLNSLNKIFIFIFTFCLTDKNVAISQNFVMSNMSTNKIKYALVGALQ